MNDKITLISSDGKNVTIPRSYAVHSATVSELLSTLGESGGSITSIPLPNVCETVLLKIFEWIKLRAEEGPTLEPLPSEGKRDDALQYAGAHPELSTRERDFFKKFTENELFALLNAANYLHVVSLVNAGSAFITEQLHGKTPEEMELPSDTSDHQRFDEMFIHLTPQGAVVPYNVALDGKGGLWVASKGGLFKFDAVTKALMWERRNLFPKKAAAYCQVVIHKDKVVYTTADDKDKLTEFRIFSLSGEKEHEQFIDGLIQSMDISESGEIYISKQMGRGDTDSFIYRTSFDTPLGWEELVSSDEFAFQALAVYDENTLIVATCSLPINMGSRQALRWIDIDKASTSKGFSAAGKVDNKIYFPRSIKRVGNEVVVMDKTGRFLRFNRNGEYKGLAAEIDAYLGNGFAVENGATAVIACSGIVLDEDKRTICDDWIEKINLDGSSWKAMREEKKK